jgi:hypothetical protein
MELTFRLTTANSGKILVQTRDNSPLGNHWSNFGLFDDIQSAAEACGEEIRYQAMANIS